MPRRLLLPLPLLGALLGALYGCACGAEESTAEVELRPAAENAAEDAREEEPVPGSAPDRAAPEAPWTIRLARACPEWTYQGLLPTSERVYGCNGVAFDRRTGAVIEAPNPLEDRTYFGLFANGEQTFWEESGGGEALRVLGERGQRVAQVAIPSQVDTMFASPDGSRVYAASYQALSLLDLEGGRSLPVPGAERCREATAYGFTRAGALQCLVRCEAQGEGRSCLRTLGSDGRQASERVLPEILHARWDPRGGRLLALSSQRARWLDEEGAELWTGELSTGEEGEGGSEHLLLDASAEGAMLVATDRAVELWSLVEAAEGAERTRRVEAVFPRRLERARFAGPEILLSTDSRDILWMHRGPARRLPELPAPETPEGFRALASDMDGALPSFDGGMFPRGPDDVAAFDAEGPRMDGHLVISRGDAAELSSAGGDDAAWAALAARRFLDPGAERYAFYWRNEAGERVLRAHTYIGGCERTHIDLMVHERGAVLERRVLYTGTSEGPRQRGLMSALGPRPDHAVEVMEARSERYPGDPSIGGR